MFELKKKKIKKHIVGKLILKYKIETNINDILRRKVDK